MYHGRKFRTLRNFLSTPSLLPVYRDEVKAQPLTVHWSRRKFDLLMKSGTNSNFEYTHCTALEGASVDLFFVLCNQYCEALWREFTKRNI